MVVRSEKNRGFEGSTGTGEHSCEMDRQAVIAAIVAVVGRSSVTVSLVVLGFF